MDDRERYQIHFLKFRVQNLEFRFCFQYLIFSVFTACAVSWTVAIRARVLFEESPDTVEQLAL